VVADIGKKLRYVWTLNGLSQRVLAKRAGVAHSAISLIEANQVNPTAGALKRGLDGIPIGLSYPNVPSRFSTPRMNLSRLAKAVSPTAKLAAGCSDVRYRS
jgi:transcriptional regulator with XRE-family HTH domain